MLPIILIPLGWLFMGFFFAHMIFDIDSNRIGLWELFWCGGVGILGCILAGGLLVLILNLWFLIIPLCIIGGVIRVMIERWSR